MKKRFGFVVLPQVILHETLHLFAGSFVQKFAGSIDEKNIIGADINDAFILAPEEWPIFFVLQKVGFQQEHSGNDSACDK